MKPWQHGYELDYLKDLEKRFLDYNSYTLSPFAQLKKNNICLETFELSKCQDKNLYSLCFSFSGPRIFFVRVLINDCASLDGTAIVAFAAALRRSLNDGAGFGCVGTTASLIN